MAKNKEKKIKTDEAKVFSALAEESYTVTLGGAEYEFKPLTLYDREQIAILASEIELKLEVTDGIVADGDALDEAIRCGKYARHLAHFIGIGAHVRGLPVIAEIQRRRIINAALDKASPAEIKLAVSKILSHIDPTFFLGCLISLNRPNILKKTKETEATARGLEKQPS